MSLFLQHTACADYLARLAETCPAGREMAYRSLMYDLLAQLPCAQAPVAYATLSGLEDALPHAWKLFRPRALALDALPSPPLITSAGGACSLTLAGEIAFKAYQTELEAIKSASRVFLTVNSCGGDSAVAEAIAEALKGKESACLVTGRAYSAALTAVQGCQRRMILRSATVMAHAIHSATIGTAGELRQSAADLDASTERILALYHRSPPEQARQWLTDGQDHYFNAEQALAAGLVDTITEPEPEQAPTPHTSATPPRVTRESADRDMEDVLVELLCRARAQFVDKEVFTDVLKLFCRQAARVSADDETACGGRLPSA